MKRYLVLALLVSGSAASCLAASDSTTWNFRDEGNIHKSFATTGQPVRLLVKNVSGYIHVSVSKSSEVLVSAHRIIRAETARDVEEAKDEVQLDMTNSPDSVSIRYETPKHGAWSRSYEVTYDIDIQAPSQTEVEASTVNGGDVKLDGTAGAFELANVNGPVNVTGVSGSGNAHTVNGSLSIRFGRNPVSASSFKTVNGTIDVYLKPELSADLRLKSLNGETYSDFDVLPVVLPVQSSEEHGKFHYRSNREKAGRIGRGGLLLSFESVNGDIRLHREK